MRNEPRHDKTNKMSVRPAKTQISLGICPVRSESSLCAQWVGKDPSFLHADSEDSDQTGRMPRLIWVFAGRTLTLLVLSCCGSNAVSSVITISFCCYTYAEEQVRWVSDDNKSSPYKHMLWVLTEEFLISTHNITEQPCDKTNKVSVRPAKTLISLGIRPVWSESSLSALKNLGSLATN